MTVSPRITTAGNFWQRLRGLMFTASLPDGDALLLRDCPSVHTCFMRYPLDVVYLNRQGSVVKLVAGLKPWRMSVGGQGAAHTLEMSVGGIRRYGLQVGDNLAPVLVGVAHA
jgi:uncharacterized membrane protein (UPF0127 family)